MNVPSGRMAALWIAALCGWLLAGAVLGAFGVPAAVLLVLHLGAVGAILWPVARATETRRARLFLLPERGGPNALTPYGGAAAWLSGFGTVGLFAAILTMGTGAFMLVAGLVGGLVVSLHLLAPALAEAKALSLPDWAAGRFGAGAGRGARGLMILSGIAVLAVQMGFAALLGEAAFGAPAPVVLPVIAVLVLLAALPGGLETMLPAQAVLFLVLLAGVLVTAFWLGIAETGIVVPHLAPGALLHEIAVAESRLGIGGEGRPFAAATLGLTALFGTLALPHTLVRWPVERRGAEARYFARRGTVCAVLVLAAVPLLAIAARADILTAALAAGVAPSLPGSSHAALTVGIAALDPPAWLLAAAGAGAMAAIVAACASAAFLVASAAADGAAPETAGGMLARARWAATGAVLAGAVLALGVSFDPLAVFLALLAGATSAFLAPLALGLLWPRLTREGALAGLVTGALWCAAALGTGWSATGGAALAGLALSAAASVAVSLARSDTDTAVTKTGP